jgi:hypothetical protein
MTLLIESPPRRYAIQTRVFGSLSSGRTQVKLSTSIGTDVSEPALWLVL